MHQSRLTLRSLQVDEVIEQAQQCRKPGLSQQAVSVKHPAHVLYPLDEGSEGELEVMAAFVPADMEV